MTRHSGTRLVRGAVLVALLLAPAFAVADSVAPPKPPARRAAAPARRDTSPPLPAVLDTATAPDPAPRPNFSGRWRLSIARSVFGKLPGGQPTARTDVIEHAGKRIRQTLYLIRGAQYDTTVYVYSTDGTPTVNRVAGTDIRSVVTWEGASLHLLSKMKVLVLDTSLDERWTLSPDGRTLTYARHVKYGIGEGDQTLKFERQ